MCPRRVLPIGARGVRCGGDPSRYRALRSDRPPQSVSPPSPTGVPTFLTRRVTFAAAHRYRRPEWDEATNQRVFGPCAHPNYHGHSYSCEVTVRGDVDPLTGFVVDLGELDDVLAAEVRGRFDHRNLNVDVPEFHDGRLVPSGENLARHIHDRVAGALSARGSRALVIRVTVAEDDTLRATYEPD
jgi:6-pyruvoyltetrahydropterin/6-carboxytetrahydropterin synthase